jgi:hypothetical protein
MLAPAESAGGGREDASHRLVLSGADVGDRCEDLVGEYVGRRGPVLTPSRIGAGESRAVCGTRRSVTEPLEGPP